MTRIDFHTNVQDTLLYMCRLVRKVYQAGYAAILLVESGHLNAFDERLWTFSSLDFVPHCLASSSLAQETPVVLTSDLDNVPHYQVLLNFTQIVPPQFTRFERLLEVVSNEPAVVAMGRKRYRFYRDLGYELNNYKQGDSKSV